MHPSILSYLRKSIHNECVFLISSCTKGRIFLHMSCQCICFVFVVNFLWLYFQFISYNKIFIFYAYIFTANLILNWIHFREVKWRIIIKLCFSNAIRDVIAKLHINFIDWFIFVSSRYGKFNNAYVKKHSDWYNPN